jgi:ribosome-associated toxin RatA of RatAB toxin-antitoxin module
MEITDEVFIESEAPRVFACCWDVELWPRITPHVKRIQMLQQKGCHQEFIMTVEVNGREHTVHSEREAVPEQRITYRQTRPPVFLKEHRGEWRLTREEGGIRVELTHQAILDEERAMQVLGARTPEEAREQVASSLKASGARTLGAIKHHLERRLNEGAGA